MNAPAKQKTLAPESPYHVIPMNLLWPSQTSAQCTRRERFTEAALADLAKSITSVGVMEPIIVRPRFADALVTQRVPEDGFEIVAGERRFLAARQAGLKEIPAILREIQDEDLLEFQLVENLQREGLHPLDEAEGYRELMAAKRINAQAVADLIGKSRSYVYARTKLLALSPEARSALQAGELDASKALLLARIPGAKMQKAALKILQEEGRWYSYRRLFEKLRDKFMIHLDKARFPLDDAELSLTDDMKVIRTVQPHIGPCTTCPHNSANDIELQAEDDRGEPDPGAYICTHRPCFDFKTEAFTARSVAAAKARGAVIIAGDEARAVVSHYGSLKGYIALDEECEYDEFPEPQPKDGADEGVYNAWQERADAYTPRTYRQLLTDCADKIVLIQDPHKGGVFEALRNADAKKGLKAAGFKLQRNDLSDPLQEEDEAPAPRKTPAEDANERAKEQARHEAENAYRTRLFQQIHAKFKGPLKKSDLTHVANWMFNQFSSSDPFDAAYPMRVMPEKLNEAELARLIVCIVIDDDLNDGFNKPEISLDYARRLKIDPAKIKKDIAAEAKAAANPEAAPKAPAKKKAAKK